MLNRKTKSTVVSGRSASHPSSDYIVDRQVGFLMRVAMQRHTAIFMLSMIEDLTQAQFAVMAKLHEVGPCSQNHLGRLVYLDVATVKGVVDRLILRGFVSTSRDPADSRRRAISLTKKGARVVESAIPAASEITADTLKPLSEREQRTLARLLKKLA
ncbi:MarR family winged helix-turn-helix transcriptional regulator [Bradyrhizobium canariense]|uniref:Transcriptional regulator, MarR family n=1 Tax=Bradyrhizobium canariense TaxID=255045 RepID=A0A1H2BIF5_9BRAD|nr:MarR family transcriptional regulator [Bradyrhizobium canariense]SDT57847.1 transcriptional regulator, MarR family [Bradyrhizobium canariense]